MASTFDTVANIISETCDIPRDTIKPESHAINDLGIDSLDFLDIAFAIDKAFGIKLPLEQWTQEVNDGKATTEQYFRPQNLARRIDEPGRRQGRPSLSGMRVEYFQLIDRIADLDLGRPDDPRRGSVPDREHHLRRALPGSSADARRAADRGDGADLRLADHRDAPSSSACRSSPPLNEAKLRALREAGPAADWSSAKLLARRLRLHASREAEDPAATARSSATPS